VQLNNLPLVSVFARLVVFTIVGMVEEA